MKDNGWVARDYGWWEAESDEPADLVRFISMLGRSLDRFLGVRM